MKNLGDITKLNGAEIPFVDIITGGSPCQDLSIAGKRKGLAGERSGLFMDQMRLIKEQRNETKRLFDKGAIDSIRPRFMVWENVPGAFSSNKGEDFRCVLEETAKVVQGDACIPGPPGGKWPHSGCIMGDGWSIAWRVHDAQFWGVPQRRKRIALVADFGGESAPEILFERKGMSGDITESGKEGEGAASDAGAGIEKTSRAISFQERAGNMTFEPGAASRLGGHCYNTYQDTTGTLSPGAHAGSYNGQDAYNDMLIVATLNARDYKDPQVVAYGLDRASFNQGKNAKYDFSVDEEKVGPQIAKGPGAVISAQNSIVRRLTPLECERLQGYPDGWTDIGEWVDSKGKKRKDSDSPRYKALGNSIALPFWQWMAHKMVKYIDGHQPTMASLFDGIGGFPLVFSRAGAKPVWASEIEEFPIAVTKIRFPEEVADYDK